MTYLRLVGMGGFEVQNFRRHEGDKYLCPSLKSSIVGMTPSRSLNSVNTAQAGKVLHVFVVLFT